MSKEKTTIKIRLKINIQNIGFWPQFEPLVFWKRLEQYMIQNLLAHFTRRIL